MPHSHKKQKQSYKSYIWKQALWREIHYPLNKQLKVCGIRIVITSSKKIYFYNDQIIKKERILYIKLFTVLFLNIEN